MCLAQRDCRWVRKPELAVKSPMEQLAEQLAVMTLQKRDKSWLEGKASETTHEDGGMRVRLVCALTELG